MDRALYIGMTGAIQTLRQQTANSHNLANASTVGFRAELAASRAEPVAGPGFATRVNNQLGAGGWDARAGAVQQTGRSLDIALREDCWLAVQAPDGQEAYTKAGDLQLDTNGQLRTASGLAVLSDAGPVSVPPSTTVSLGSDGSVSALPLGQAASAQVLVGRLKVVSVQPDQLQRGSDGLMRALPGSTPEPAPGDVLMSGALESSNVNLADAMVNMIELARQFELQVKMMHSVEENANAASSLVRMS